MRNESITGGWKKLKSDLTAMSMKEKLNHLWTYYKGALVILVILIAIGSIVVTSCRARNTTTRLSGISINVQLSDEGQAYVKDEYFLRVSQGGLEQVIYSETYQESFANTTSLEDSYMGLMSLIALATSEELDYMLLDETALTNMLPHNIYMDLRKFFTEDELEALGDSVIWMEMGDEETGYTATPVAVKISDLPFMVSEAKCVSDIYFSVVTNTPRAETVRDFWEYIHAWTPAA